MQRILIQGIFQYKLILVNLGHTRNNIIKTFEKKNLKFFEKTVLDGNAARFLAKKNRVRQNTTVQENHIKGEVPVSYEKSFFQHACKIQLEIVDL